MSSAAEGWPGVQRAHEVLRTPGRYKFELKNAFRVELLRSVLYGLAERNGGKIRCHAHLKTLIVTVEEACSGNI